MCKVGEITHTVAQVYAVKDRAISSEPARACQILPAPTPKEALAKLKRT
jgi:hypothetical protein